VLRPQISTKFFRLLNAGQGRQKNCLDPGEDRRVRANAQANVVTTTKVNPCLLSSVRSCIANLARTFP